LNEYDFIAEDEPTWPTVKQRDVTEMYNLDCCICGQPTNTFTWNPEHEEVHGECAEAEYEEAEDERRELMESYYGRRG
jgi:hypothetical protein